MSYCGPRITVNSQICVPNYPSVAKGDLIPLTDMSAWSGSSTSTGPVFGNNAAADVYTSTGVTTTSVYAAQSCGKSYFMS